MSIKDMGKAADLYDEPPKGKTLPPWLSILLVAVATFLLWKGVTLMAAHFWHSLAHFSVH